MQGIKLWLDIDHIILSSAGTEEDIIKLKPFY